MDNGYDNNITFYARIAELRNIARYDASIAFKCHILKRPSECEYRCNRNRFPRLFSSAIVFRFVCPWERRKRETFQTIVVPRFPKIPPFFSLTIILIKSAEVGTSLVSRSFAAGGPANTAKRLHNQKEQWGKKRKNDVWLQRVLTSHTFLGLPTKYLSWLDLLFPLENNLH